MKNDTEPIYKTKVSGITSGRSTEAVKIYKELLASKGVKSFIRSRKTELHYLHVKEKVAVFKDYHEAKEFIRILGYKGIHTTKIQLATGSHLNRARKELASRKSN